MPETGSFATQFGEAGWMTKPGRIPEKLDFSTIGEVLYRFAQDHEQALSQILTNGFWSWALLKEAVFHLLLGRVIRNTQAGESAFPVASISRNRIGVLIQTAWFPFKVIGCCLRYRGQKPVVILSNQSDRIMSDEAGNRLNPMFDVLIRDQLTHRPMLLLENAPMQPLSNPAVQPNLYLGPMAMYTRLLARIYMLLGAERKQSVLISELFNSWFGKYHLEAHLDPGEIRVMLCRFRAIAFLYRLVWMGLRPAMILGSERGATGECASARRMGIPMLEFQHGLMDRYYTDYMYPEWMTENQGAAAAPEALVLFGARHGDFLAEAGFWKPHQLLAAGSFRVDSRRETHANVPGKVILFANQWHVFSHAAPLFTEWLSSGWLQQHGWKLNIKLHPLDPPHVCAFFEAICRQYPDTCTLFGTGTDIYQQIPNARVLLGYDSTVLVEAVCLGRPVISIDPGIIEGGLHTYVPFTTGLSSIRLAQGLEGIQASIAILEDEHSQAYTAWMEQVKNEGPGIFTPGYIENVRKILQKWLKEAT